MKLFTSLVVLLSMFMIGCGGEPPPSGELPACDTQRTVWFVSLCFDGERARCALLSTAPAGAMASGCELTVVGTAGPRQVECVETCE